MTLLDRSAGTQPGRGDRVSVEQPTSPVPHAPSDAGDLSAYARTAARSLRGAALGAALGLALAALILVRPPGYTAVSTVSINPLTGELFNDSQSASKLIDPATEVAVAQSDRVFRLAVEEYGATDVSIDDLREAVDVTPVDASTVLRIAVTAGAPDDAQQRADAVAEAYLEERAQAANRRQDALVAQLESSLAAIDLERKAAGARFKAAPEGSVAREQALADHTAIIAQRDSLRSQLRAISELEGTGGEVLTSAVSVPAEITPDRRLTLTSGILGGGIIGFVVAFLLAQFGTRIRRSEHLAKLPELRFAAAVGAKGGVGSPGDVEVLRALREQRRVDGWPEMPHATVTMLDQRRSVRLDVPLALARTLAPEHGSSTVLALGWEPTAHEGELERHGLRAVGDHHRTMEEPQVTLRAYRRDDSASASDAYFTDQARAALDSIKSRGGAVVVWIPGSCGESTRLAVLSGSDTLVLVVEPSRSKVPELRRRATEAAGAGVAWVGALLVR